MGEEEPFPGIERLNAMSEADFASANLKGRYLPASRNAVLIGATTRTTSYTAINGRIVNRGVDVARISAATRLRIEPVRVVHSETLAGTGIRGAGQLTVYRPRVIAAGLLIWSACTGASGFAHSFEQMVAARFLVALKADLERGA